MEASWHMSLHMTFPERSDVSPLRSATMQIEQDNTTANGLDIGFLSLARAGAASR
jgi:hypothetical protein